jgi:polyphosphate kinase
MTAIHKPKAAVEQFLDRDQSILDFNRRVLSWARRDDVPALERLRYICIVSSNLDEFFEVRASQHLLAVGAQDNKGAYSVASFTELANAAHALVDDQYKVFNDAVTPALEARGVHVVSHGHRSARQRKWVKDYFEREVLPLLMPVGLDPAHPFPLVANKSLNFIVRLVGKDAFGRSNEIAIVKVPRVLPRLMRIPSLHSNGDTSLVSLSSIIRSHLVDLFPGRLVSEFSQFRVTRHSDLAVDQEDARNLRTALRLGLQQRNYGQAVRLEVSSGCSHFLSEFLTAQFGLPPGAVYRVHGPVNLVRFNQLIELVDKPDLLFPAYRPIAPLELLPGVSIFNQMRERDILIHQPFESFDGVMAFLREAVHDPQVLTIRQTIYRTGAQSEMMDLLGEAVRLGKEVTVVVELKARFDEEANINWAEALEALGAQVVYGVVGLKTHAKMLLVTRREGKALRRYGHLSTGNYNPGTAKLYTDLSHLTVNPEITADMQAVFVHMAGQSKLPKLKRLWLAPFDLQKNLIDKIDSVAQAGAHKDRRIITKMNALTDEALMLALLRAARLGVKIDLIVRGACTLPLTDPVVRANVVVRSVIGRFLEHSRIFYFRVSGVEEVYLSSADWMNRNMLRRIEIAWPVLDAKLRQRVVDECLVPYLNDTTDAWFMQPDGTYNQVVGVGSLSAQAELAKRHTHLVHAKKNRSTALGA